MFYILQPLRGVELEGKRTKVITTPFLPFLPSVPAPKILLTLSPRHSLLALRNA